MFIMQQGENANERRRVYLHLVDGTDGITAKTGQTGKAKIITNGTSPKDTTNSIVEVDSSNAPGLYYIELTTQELQALGWIQVRYKASGTAEFQDIGQVVGYDPYNRNLFNPWQQVAGPDIDYKRIDKLVESRVSGMKFPDAKEVDLVPISVALQALLTEIRGIVIPEAKDTDLTAVMAKFEALQAAVAAIKIPETDLSPVLQAVHEGREEVKPHAEATRAEVEAILTRIREFFTSDMDAIKAEVAKINKRLSKIPVMYVNAAKEEEND